MGSVLRLISLLILSITTGSAVDRFPEKFVAVDKHSDVTLHCGTTDPGVVWQYDSEEVEPSNLIELRGNDLILRKFEVDQMGNYTCWRGHEIVDYTYVLLNMPSKVNAFNINCTAETFNCTYSISCSIKPLDFDFLRLCNQRDGSSCVQRSENGLFYLTHSTNPYAEEAERLVVIGEAVSSSDRYFKTSHSFYLRDIIKPACPEVSVINRSVSLKPPQTWAKPSSYYPLDHEIQCKERDNGTVMPCKLDQNEKVPKGTSEIRVRCRDSLLLSQWSEWTQWQNVRKRDKKHRGKKNKQHNQRS